MLYAEKNIFLFLAFLPDLFRAAQTTLSATVKPALNFIPD